MDANEVLKDQIKDLYQMFLDGDVESQWDAEFIESITRQFEAGRTFSDRQLEKIEELVDKYL